jgi:hypothetical protein
MVAQTKIAEPNVVNGINVDDLFALIDGVRRDAAKGKSICHAVSSRSRRQRIVSDETLLRI